MRDSRRVACIVVGCRWGNLQEGHLIETVVFQDSYGGEHPIKDVHRSWPRASTCLCTPLFTIAFRMIPIYFLSSPNNNSIGKPTLTRTDVKTIVGMRYKGGWGGEGSGGRQLKLTKHVNGHIRTYVITVEECALEYTICYKLKWYQNIA